MSDSNSQALARMEWSDGIGLSKADRFFIRLYEKSMNNLNMLFPLFGVVGYAVTLAVLSYSNGGYEGILAVIALFGGLGGVLMSLPYGLFMENHVTIRIVKRLRTSVIPEILDEMEASGKADLARLALVIRKGLSRVPERSEELFKWMNHLRARVRDGVPLPPNFLTNLRVMLDSSGVRYLSSDEKARKIIQKYNLACEARTDNYDFYDEEDMLPVVIAFKAMEKMLDSNTMQQGDKEYVESLNAIESIVNGLQKERRPDKGYDVLKMAFAGVLLNPIAEKG